MARRIEEGHAGIAEVENGLFREYGNAPAALQPLGIQECVLMVDPPEGPDGARLVQHGFRHGSLACVHVGEDADRRVFHASIVAQEGCRMV